MSTSKTRCPSCGRPIRLREIDDSDESIAVSGRALDVAIQIPGLAGYTVVTAERLHKCPRPAPRPRSDLAAFLDKRIPSRRRS